MGKMADIDEMMYSCGIDILHPGGIQKTDEMATMCKIGKDASLLDVGVGKGVTACYLAKKYGCTVTGIDASARMIEASRERAKKEELGDRVNFRIADAHRLPFGKDTFDVVLTECTTVLLDKSRAFSEFLRVTKPGGYVGDLEITWQRDPPEEALKETYEVWEGFQTMTLEGWKAFLEGLGLEDVRSVDFSGMIPDMEKAMRQELGAKGMLKFASELAVHGSLRRGWKEYERIFDRYVDYIGYGFFVGRKPGDEADR